VTANAGFLLYVPLRQAPLPGVSRFGEARFALMWIWAQGEPRCSTRPGVHCAAQGELHHDDHRYSH